MAQLQMEQCSNVSFFRVSLGLELYFKFAYFRQPVSENSELRTINMNKCTIKIMVTLNCIELESEYIRSE